MHYPVKSTAPSKIKTDCLVVATFNDTLSEEAQEIDIALSGQLSQLVKQSGLGSKSTGLESLYNISGVNAKNLVLIQLGSISHLNNRKLTIAFNGLVKKLRSMPIKSTTLCLANARLSEMSIIDHFQMIARYTDGADYHYDSTKSDKAQTSTLKQISLHVNSSADTRAAKTGIRYGLAISQGIKLSKQLANLPGNICTPSYLGEQAKKLALSHGLKTRVLNEKQMNKLGMASLLSVSKGSDEPAKFITMHYNGGSKNQAPVVLVGKGLTFDSGGISIKPAASMDEMKYDMCGGASVFGTLLAVSEMQLPINVIGVVPSCENLINGQANKPGDVVTSMSGKTIEILNTDAEGRLILCDALTYVERFKPAAVVDIATLTGACVIALGAHATGMMANDQAVADKLIAAGEQCHDRVWQLPLWDEYQRQLRSNFADIANIGGRQAGAITAGCFLARFTEQFRWAHLDIAGTAWLGGDKKGATGRPVSLLCQFLINHSIKTI